KVGPEGMAETAGRFGYNDTGLRIPSGVARSNFDTDMSEDQLAHSSIGQFNTTATPLQMAMVAAAVANGGDLRRPYLVDRVTAADGDTVQQQGPRPYERPMSPSTAVQLQRMMVDVVEKGTGSNAAI
nr:penicillin-binding transpeptidase domain-containing protein [Streptomyces sp. DSM 41633]